MLRYSSSTFVDIGIFVDIEDDGRFFRELVKVYLKQSPEVILGIKEALKIGDWRVVKSLTQSLKVTSSNVGAILIEFMCHKLGEMNGGYRPAAINQISHQLDRQFEATKLEFDKFFAGPSKTDDVRFQKAV